MLSVCVEHANRRMVKARDDGYILAVVFADGFIARIPHSDIRNYEDGQPITAPIDTLRFVDEYEISGTSGSGEPFEIPWDFARFYAKDPEFKKRMREVDLRGRAFVAGNIRRIREERNLTQQALSDLTSVPRVTIARLERGAHVPNLDTILKLAQGLQLDVNQMLPVTIPD